MSHPNTASDQSQSPGIPPAAEKWRKKPVIIEAMQFDRGNNDKPHLESIWRFCPTAAWVGVGVFADLVIPTLEGEMRCAHGDWIIRGVKGEFYPCKPDIFAATYERVEPPDVSSDQSEATQLPQSAPDAPPVQRGVRTENEGNLITACLRTFLNEPVDFAGYNLIELSNRVAAEREAEKGQVPAREDVTIPQKALAHKEESKP